jgi:predicted Zn-dependent protease
MKLSNALNLSSMALLTASCSVPTVTPPTRVPAAYPIEVAVPRVKPRPVPKKPKPRPYRAKVERYAENVATRVEDLDDKKPMTAIISAQTKERNLEAESNRLDPYAKRRSGKRSKPSRNVGAESDSSSAVMALMLRAKLDMLAGRSEVAIDKLERGLRIQPNNPDLWNKLAEAHFHGKNYQQTVAMSKKSISLSEASNRDLLRRNWKLIAKANQKMGNMEAMKAAMRAENSV